MSLELPRADDLRILRSLCHFLAQQHGKRSSLHELETWLRSPPSRATPWKRSRAYHYTSAARELNLVQVTNAGTWKLTTYGRKLATCREGRVRLDTSLNEAEKALFRLLIPKYGAVRKYLAYYMPGGKRPTSVDDFVKRGRPIELVKSGPSQYAMLTASNRSITIDRTRKGSYAWTLFNWLRTLGIIDDLYKEKPQSFLLEENEVRIFYPVRSTDLSVAALRNMLVAKATTQGHRVTMLYLPRLLREFCAARGIPEHLFFRRLIQLHHTDPHHFHLEMMSSLRSDSRCKHYRYENFPVVEGVRRSHVCVLLDDECNETQPN